MRWLKSDPHQNRELHSHCVSCTRPTGRILKCVTQHLHGRECYCGPFFLGSLTPQVLQLDLDVLVSKRDGEPNAVGFSDTLGQRVLCGNSLVVTYVSLRCPGKCCGTEGAGWWAGLACASWGSGPEYNCRRTFLYNWAEQQSRDKWEP